MENTETYQNGKKNIEGKIGFYKHLSIYTAVNILLIIINVINSPEYFWFKWPLMGWGVAILFHALGTFKSSGKATNKE